ncbi:MAG: 50S ribosomal protein L11 methyltransferase [Trueperaceae bacterium]|nr:50S ribosomal protein L11 methyltransferase [Trueperaceae bacterium]
MSVAFRFRGVLEQADQETALLWEAGCRGIAQEGDEVVAYFDARVDVPLAGDWSEVDDTDWIEAYYADLKPVVLDTLIVAPTHRQLSGEEIGGRKVIWLDPGMVFGTGHHATTRMALAALETFELPTLDVVDLGAGSGILAIAAALLGARTVYGLDLDADTLPVARANADLNHVTVGFRHGTLSTDTAADSADLVVANLFAEAHAGLADAYAHVVRPGGWLLITGILSDRLGLVREGLEPYFSVAETVHEDEWSLVKAQRLA